MAGRWPESVSPSMDPDLVTVRSPFVNFHVLRDDGGLYLLDAGFIGGRRLLARELKRHGWDREPIRGIILSHGHLDHILNVESIASETGAWIAAPRLDADHFAGKPAYRGASKVTGWLEAMGRPLLGFRPFTPNRWIGDGDVIDVWHGLKAVHLPGHTPGHTGFHCERHKLLFCGDLFASYRGFSHFAPSIFNLDPGLISLSVSRAISLPIEGVIPNHADAASPAEHLARLKRLAVRSI